MKGTKKAFIGVLILLGIAVLGILYFLNAKTKDSRALAQYIPPSGYIAHLNTKAALKLAYALRNDTSALRSSSKWSALFTDSTKTGIDYLVDPWIFGDTTNMNIAFQLSSVMAYAQWMKEVADSSFVLDKIMAFHVKDNGMTFFTNGSKAALLSFAPLPIAVKTGIAFYSKKKNKAISLQMGDELARIKLTKSLFFGSFLELKDTSLVLNVTEDEITINNQNAISLNKTFSLGYRLNPAKWSKLKGNKKIKNAFQILGLEKINLQAEPFLNFTIQDTFHKVSQSYTFEFDDDFNKVKVAKVSRKVLPNIAITFTFKNKNERDAFIKRNRLSAFKHDFLQVFKGEKWLMFGMKNEGIENLSIEHLMLNKQMLTKTLSWNKQFKGIKLNAIQEIKELVYINDPNKGTYLKLATEKHPLVWLAEYFKDNK